MDEDEHAGALALIADDDEATRRVLVQALAHLGFDARAYPSSASLAFAMAPLRPDLLIVDQHVRGGFGSLAVRRFRALGAVCPTIVLTSFPGEELRHELAMLGRFALLAKPVDLRTLRQSIDQLSRQEPSASCRVEGCRSIG